MLIVTASESERVLVAANADVDPISCCNATASTILRQTTCSAHLLRNPDDLTSFCINSQNCWSCNVDYPTLARPTPGDPFGAAVPRYPQTKILSTPLVTYCKMLKRTYTEVSAGRVNNSIIIMMIMTTRRSSRTSYTPMLSCHQCYQYCFTTGDLPTRPMMEMMSWITPHMRNLYKVQE